MCALIATKVSVVLSAGMPFSSRYPTTGTPFDRAGAVLAAHHIGVDVGAHQRLQRAQHLELLVAHRIRVIRHRRFHRHDAQQLQQVILHHVAQRAGLVIERAASLDAELLGHRDLHVTDAAAAPQRLEQAELPKRSASRFCTASLPR
jgi:hypothetical protein